jgi:hypothetical protein
MCQHPAPTTRYRAALADVALESAVLLLYGDVGSSPAVRSDILAEVLEHGAPASCHTDLWSMCSTDSNLRKSAIYTSERVPLRRSV